MTKQFCVLVSSRIRNSECESQQKPLGGHSLSSKTSQMWKDIIQEDGGLSTPLECLEWYIPSPDSWLQVFLRKNWGEKKQIIAETR